MMERVEKGRRRTRYAVVFAALILALFVIAFLNINIGSAGIPADRIFRIIFLGEGEAAERAIIMDIRMPRVIMAALLGGGLSISGFLLQTFFGNPVAGPYVLGISSGARLFVSLAMVFFLQRFKSVSSWTLILTAFAGAMMSTGWILLISRKMNHMASLLVAGIMIGYICSAFTDFVITFAEDQDIVNLHGWTQGSFSGSTWGGIAVAGIVVGASVVLVFLLQKPIGAYQMGEQYASSVGVNIRMFRTVLILLSSVLSACVTAFAGPVSFVGMAVPHLVKQSLGTSRPLVVIPGIFLGGAVFCAFCDLVARTLFSPLELNISTVTSIFGAPVVIFILLKRKSARGGAGA